MGFAAFSKPAGAVRDEGYVPFSRAGGHDPDPECSPLPWIPVSAQGESAMGDRDHAMQARKRSGAADRRPNAAGIIENWADRRRDRSGNHLYILICGFALMKRIATAFLLALLIISASLRLLVAQDNTVQQSIEYRALRYAIPLLPASKVAVDRVGELRVLNVFGKGHHITVQGPGPIGPWKDDPRNVWNNGIPWQDITAPWGGPLHSRYMPKTDDTRRNNPYGDDGNSASIAWIWTYPRYVITVSCWWEGDVRQDVRPIAEAIHRGFVEDGLAGESGNSRAPNKEGVPDTEGTPWKLVVGLGAGAALAIGALAKAMAAKAAAAKTIAATAARKSAGNNEKKEDPDRAVGYILQLSTNQLTLKTGAPAALAVTVWAAKADGSHSLAADAQIQLTPSINLVGLRIEPSSGTGRLQSTILWGGGRAPSPSMTLMVTATAGGGTYSGSVSLALEIAQIVYEFEGGKSAIRPDGKDSTVLKAKVVQDGAGTVNNEATAAVEFAKSNEWLDTSDSVMWGATWKAITVQALDPAGPDSRRQPPSPVSITIRARCGETDLSSSAPVELLLKPELDVDLRPDTITLIQGDATPVRFHAIIANPGTEKWDWKIALEKDDFCTVGFKEPGTPGVIDVTVTPPATSPDGTSGAQVLTKMHIFAEQSGVEPLERILPVVLAREGLIVRPRGRDGEGRYVLRCDMETRKEIDFIVYVKDQNGRLIASPEFVRKLWFEDNCQEQQMRNLLSVAKPEIKPDKPTEEKGYTWTARSQDYVPGETGEEYNIPMTVRVIGKEDKPEFSSEFVLALKVMEPDIGSDDWRKELEGCYRAIRFVPEPAKSKLAEAIQKHAQTLGHEGLKLFRKKIWRIAQDLILAEGAEGYKDEDKWAGRCLFLAENIKWGTDLVFTAASSVAFGPVGAIGAPMLKSLIEKILVVASERGFGEVDDWFWECVTDLEQTLDWASVMKQGALVAGGMITDPAVLEKILGNSPKQKAAAWGIYVGFQFASNMARGMSMCDAIKQTMRTVRDRLVVQFLIGRMNWAYKTPQAIKDAAARMTGNPPRMTEADMIAIQSDPQLLRSLKTAPANIQQGFLKTYRDTLITPHDAQLVAHVRTLPEYQGRIVRVETFSTPGKSGSGVGADRDFRVTMQNPDGTWQEVPSELWKEGSNRIVNKLSGGRSLQQLNWRATDRFDIEASPDYATQNGQISNITRVIRGKATLKDPKQFGNMWQQKMSGVEPGHNVPPLENVAQAQKACNTLSLVRSGYRQQGYNVGNLTPQMQKGMQIVQGANVTATGDYNSVNQALQNAGFKGGFSDFANKVAGQFQALGMARKA
jgi:hypothetical protein